MNTTAASRSRREFAGSNCAWTPIATGNRNIFAVSIDPYLNLFTRDNTNDGGGWNSRLSLMQRDAAYGYPSLFTNFGDEIIPCIADYGGGGATGSMYIHEPNFPGNYG